MEVGVDRITVVTTIVLPLETERKVDGISEGVRVALDGEVVVVEGVENDVEEGVWVEVDEDVDCTEVDDDDDEGVELPPEELV